MSSLTISFLEFLGEKYKKTGQTVFRHTDYFSFPNYEQAITDLANRGVIENTNDILGTIILRIAETK